MKAPRRRDAVRSLIVLSLVLAGCSSTEQAATSKVASERTAVDSSPPTTARRATTVVVSSTISTTTAFTSATPIGTAPPTSATPSNAEPIPTAATVAPSDAPEGAATPPPLPPVGTVAPASSIRQPLLPAQRDCTKDAQALETYPVTAQCRGDWGIAFADNCDNCEGGDALHRVNGKWIVAGGIKVDCGDGNGVMPKKVFQFFSVSCSFLNGEPLASGFHPEGSAPPYSQGDAGFTVWSIQVALNDHGIGVDPDGYFGQGTVAAVKAFQLSKGLAVDGIVGRASMNALGLTR
jgi:Putative peptidoglycan binding domain